jgi:hypothetical protein
MKSYLIALGMLAMLASPLAVAFRKKVERLI